MPRLHQDCPDCNDAQQSSVTRRQFVQAGAAALAAGALPLGLGSRSLQAAPTPQSGAETAVKQLFDSLSDKQRSAICFGFDHASRTKINANWAISEARIASDFYTDDQRHLIGEIFKGVTSEDGHERFLKQMEHDDGGFDQYHIAIFGEPGSEQFEWALTGRHLTIRADGNTTKGVALGGPVVYGHGEEDPAQNLFHYQTKAANEVFKALDAKQAEAALLDKPPRENNVELPGSAERAGGIAVSELSSDQKELVESVVKVLLAPYRDEDVKEALAMLKEGGGLDSLRMAFFKQGDLNYDQVWDIWRIEGPTFVSHFRGAPHVHAYLNVGLRQS
ncbi:MAG: DUF3500 domain-containing protein [Planctomycetaceae bacterium]|nr:DUF3500 domain-containing protein [Planctomycetaceae bacterium]